MAHHRIRKLAPAVAALAVALGACVPPDPGTGGTTTTTAQPGYTTFQFNDQRAVPGPGCTGCLLIVRGGPDGAGNTVFITVNVTDTNQAADGGYSWVVTNGFNNPENCRYPLVQVRGRANIGDGTAFSTTYRMDFDGYETTASLKDLLGPWDFQSGDIPTVIMESVTLDTSAPICND